MQNTFHRLQQGYRHSPTTAHNALAKVLGIVEVLEDVHRYKYIDDIPIGGALIEFQQ